MYVYVTVYVAISVNIYRDALISIYPNIETLMCYFHVVNCCKKNLRSHQAPTQKVIMYNKVLASAVTMQENTHWDQAGVCRFLAYMFRISGRNHGGVSVLDIPTRIELGKLYEGKRECYLIFL